MSSAESICRDLKKTIIEMIGDIKDCICTTPEEEGDMLLCEFFFEQMHPERVMNHIVEKVLPWKAKIKKRDIDYFLNNMSIFNGIDEKCIEKYTKKIADPKCISEENRNTIWAYFDIMITLSEKYKKHK